MRRFLLSDYNIYTNINGDTETWARTLMAEMLDVACEKDTSLYIYDNTICTNKEGVDAVVAHFSNAMRSGNAQMVMQTVNRRGAYRIFRGKEFVGTVCENKYDESGNTDVGFVIASTNHEYIETMREFIESKARKDERPINNVSLVINGSGGPYLRTVPIRKLEFTRDNYPTDIVHGFDRIVADINSPNPTGRLAILDGRPGTGKTSFIRGILNEKVDARIVFLPSNMLTDLSGPSVIKLFLPDDDLKSDDNDDDDKLSQRTVVILEDADDCLVKRDINQMSTMTNLLNLTDGILGEVTNLYIIATTNTPIDEDFDEALMRKGRLSAFLKFKGVPKNEARALFMKIHNKTSEEADVFIEQVVDNVTLAEIYNFYNESGTAIKKPAKVGF